MSPIEESSSKATAAGRLAEVAPQLQRILTRGSVAAQSPARFAESQIRRETVRMRTRDGQLLATDLYLPPDLPAPAVAMRTPYGRAADRFASTFMAFARRGYVVISQDCRGTGDSEPDVWDFATFEGEDGEDFVEWVTRQSWYSGFLSAFGGSYAAGTQFCMAVHPRMSAIAPEVAGLQVTRRTARRYMFVNAFSRVVGKGGNRLNVPLDQIERLVEPETMAGGYFNEPLPTPIPERVFDSRPDLRQLPVGEVKRQLWAEACAGSAQQRGALFKALLGVDELTYSDYTALITTFDSLIPYSLHGTPSVDAAELCSRYRAPVLFIASWYDWNLRDALAGWTVFQREARSEVAAASRLLITPAAHLAPGYREGAADHPELQHDHRSNVDLLLQWYAAVREGRTERWPKVIYYLMGANEWRTADDWPVPGACEQALYLAPEGGLAARAPDAPSASDRYVYDPADPTPTVGGSILSFLYTAGSADVSAVQRRSDVLTYTTAPFEQALDVVGPLRLILFVSSSAIDTDFLGRVSDVFPDGRALQLQSAILRARYRNLTGDPEPLVPGQIYRLELDLWATANRFEAGHCLRLDISSADFPRYDRNANRGGQPGAPLPAQQNIYRDREHPSCLMFSILESTP